MTPITRPTKTIQTSKIGSQDIPYPSIQSLHMLLPSIMCPVSTVETPLAKPYAAPTVKIDKVFMICSKLMLGMRGAFKLKLLLTSHRGTCIGTAFTGCGASFAVFHVVLAAFGCASLANFRAKGAYFIGVCIATRDRCCSQLAEISTCHISGYAGSHRFWIILFHASCCALQTSNSALVAGADAIGFFLAKHVDSLKLPKIRHFHFGVYAERWL